MNSPFFDKNTYLFHLVIFPKAIIFLQNTYIEKRRIDPDSSKLLGLLFSGNSYKW